MWRDLTSLFINIKEFVRPPINAHILMYAALSRSAWRLALEPDLRL
jgi:hypothetical protein